MAATVNKVCKSEDEVRREEEAHGFFKDEPVVFESARVASTRAWREYYRDLHKREYILSDGEYQFALRFARNVEETNPLDCSITLTLKKWSEDLFEAESNGPLADECICQPEALPVFFRLAHLLPSDYTAALSAFKSDKIKRVVLNIRR